VLIALEIFVFPGTAVLGVSGVILVLGGLGLATLERWPQSEGEWLATVGSLGRFGLALTGAIIAAIIAARYLPSIPYANRLVLVPPTDGLGTGEDGPAHEPSPYAGLLGAIGVAATTLRPSGMVRFGEEYVDVVAEGSYVEPGTRVQVIEIEGNRVVVKEV
jgi:membrane-bound ClpP family serine protease